MIESFRYAVASLRDGEHVVKTNDRQVAEQEKTRLDVEQRFDFLQRKKTAPNPDVIVPHPGYEVVELPQPDQELS